MDDSTHCFMEICMTFKNVRCAHKYSDYLNFNVGDELDIGLAFVPTVALDPTVPVLADILVLVVVCCIGLVVSCGFPACVCCTLFAGVAAGRCCTGRLTCCFG